MVKKYLQRSSSPRTKISGKLPASSARWEPLDFPLPSVLVQYPHVWVQFESGHCWKLPAEPKLQERMPRALLAHTS